VNPVVHLGGDAMTRSVVASNRLMALWRRNRQKSSWRYRLVLVGFVIGHMLGNLKIFAGPNEINAYCSSSAKWVPALSYGQLLWLVRIVLLICVTLHITAAIQLTRMSWLRDPLDTPSNEISRRHSPRE